MPTVAQLLAWEEARQAAMTPAERDRDHAREQGCDCGDVERCRDCMRRPNTVRTGTW